MDKNKCKECGKEVEDQIEECPHCGFQFQESLLGKARSQLSQLKEKAKIEENFKKASAAVKPGFDNVKEKARSITSNALSSMKSDYSANGFKGLLKNKIFIGLCTAVLVLIIATSGGDKRSNGPKQTQQADATAQSSRHQGRPDNIFEAAKIHNASRDISYLDKPPLTVSENKYFLWYGAIERRNEDTYYVKSPSGQYFIINKIKTAYGDLSFNEQIGIVGRYSGTVNATLVSGRTITIPVLEDCYTGSAVLMVDNGDGTVTDLITGLMWVKAPFELPGNSDGMRWDEAVTFCSNLNYAGYDDWRLPLVGDHQAKPRGAEFETLGRAEASSSGLWVGLYYTPFQGIKYGDLSGNYARYWSGSVFKDSLIQVFVLYLGTKTDDPIVASHEKSSSSYVWPVRGGK